MQRVAINVSIVLRTVTPSALSARKLRAAWMATSSPAMSISVTAAPHYRNDKNACGGPDGLRTGHA
jgi:hypothetical protein